MIHVPDVRATTEWYAALGFTLCDTWADDEENLSFAIMAFGESQVMFNTGGQRSDRERREVDLYMHVDDVDALYARIRGRAEVVQAPHDTAYGMREFTIRDLNRFWLTFGQEIPDADVERP